MATPLNGLALYQQYRAQDQARALGEQQLELGAMRPEALMLDMAAKRRAMEHQGTLEQFQMQNMARQDRAQQANERYQQGRLLAAQGGHQQPLTAEGKLNADLKAGRITQDQYTQANKKALGDVDIIKPEHAKLTGEEYLNTLPVGLRNDVRALVEGDVDVKNYSIRNNQRAAMQQHAEQVDPTYNSRRFAMKQEYFSKGITKNNLTNLNQAILHMGTLKDLSDAVKNGDVQAMNSAVNFVKTQMGHPEVTSASMAQQAVSEELMRVFRGSGSGSEREAKDFENKLFTKQGSPAQQAEALRVGTELLNGRIKTLEEQYSQGMGHERFAKGLLQPSARAAWEKLRGGGAKPAEGGGGTLSAQEQSELDQLRTRFRGARP